MYELKEVIQANELIRNIKNNLIKLINVIDHEQDFDLTQLKDKLILEFLKLKKVLKRDKEYYNVFFKQKINLFDKICSDLFEDSIIHKSKLSKYMVSKKSNEVLNRLKYLNDELINKIFSTVNHIISTYQNVALGSAKKPLPKNEITEYEIYGPINKIILDLKYIFKKWVRNNNANCIIWIGGSCLDGVSPVKGIFNNDQFIAYKPIDYKKISDIDIGIGLDRTTYGNDIPAYLQNKDKININNPFGSKIFSLASESINKDRIKKEFGECKLKYVNLIESIEHLKIKNITLKDRGINLEFFLIDEVLPSSKGLQRFQRKFIIIDNFKQPNIKKEEQNKQQEVLTIIHKRLGKLDEEKIMLEFIMNATLEKSNLKNIAKDFSEKFSISRKKSQNLIRIIYSSVFK